MQWCRDSAHFFEKTSTDVDACISKANELDAQNATVAKKESVYFVPAFSGLFAPYWDSSARGSIMGLTAFHTRDHIVRAAVEATAFSVTDVIEAMCKDTNTPLQQLEAVKVDGGMTKSAYLMQFQADMLQTSLNVPKELEMTALGAIFAAGIGVGIYAHRENGITSQTYKEKISSIWNLGQSFGPQMEKATKDSQVRRSSVSLMTKLTPGSQMQGWHKAVARSSKWME